MFESFAVILVAFAVVVFLVLGIKTVPQGYEWAVERFGRYTRTLGSGLHVIVPIIDRVGRKERVVDITRQELITADNAMVGAEGVVFFQVLDAARAANEVGDLPRAIQNLAITNIRSILGSMKLDVVLSGRDEINRRLLSVVDETAHQWGIKVTRIEIKDISPLLRGGLGEGPFHLPLLR